MRKIITWVVLLFLLVSITYFIFLFNSFTFFAYRNPVKSDVLIIEAWIPSFEVEQALPVINSDSISSVIIVGKNYPNDSDSIFTMFQNKFENAFQSEKLENAGIWLYANSSLVFNLRAASFACELDDTLAIAIRAKGSESAGFFSHFNVIINGNYCGGAFTKATDSAFLFEIKQPAEGLQSIVVRFDNDLVYQNIDRNLNILSVKVGESEIDATDQNSILIKDAGSYSSGFDSQADELKNYLIQTGIPTDKVTSISFESVRRNQTLAAAKAFKNYSSSGKISSLNLVSSGLHSRRTWLTYKRLLGDGFTVGVINFKQSDFKKGTQDGNRIAFIHLIDESFSYLFNWIYLTLGGR
jgi:hypothetical protein